MGELFYRKDGGIMGPMFEHRPVTMQQRVKGWRAVLLPARPQDQVMCAGERVDAVHLTKAKRPDDTRRIGAFPRPGLDVAQPMQVQKQPAGVGIVENLLCRHVWFFSRSVSRWIVRT